MIENSHAVVLLVRPIMLSGADGSLNGLCEKNND